MTRAEYILSLIEKKGDEEGFFGKGKGKHQEFVKGTGFHRADKYTATSAPGKSRITKKEGGDIGLEKTRSFPGRKKSKAEIKADRRAKKARYRMR